MNTVLTEKTTHHVSRTPARSPRRPIRAGAVAATALLLAAAAPAVAQDRPESPFAGVSAVGYPDGSRLHALYEQVEGGVELPGLSGRAPDRSAIAAASGREARLPEGFAVAAGETIRVGQEGEPAQRSAGGVPAKYITLHSITYRGVPLSKGSDYLTLVDAEGRLLARRVRNLPLSVDATQATVNASAAARTAGAAARRELGRAVPAVGAPALEVWVDPGRQGRLSWTLTVGTDSLTDPWVRRYWISAVGQPTVLHWEWEVYYTHFGTGSATVWDGSPFGPSGNHILEQLAVTRTGGGGGSAVTGSDGRYAFLAGGGHALLSAVPKGPHSVVDHVPGAELAANGSGLPAAAIDLNFGAAGDLELAQTTAFHWTNAAHRLAADILLPADLPNLTTRVNIAAQCNAFWNGSSINFFQAGGPCPNTAYSDVVFHEYGHGVDARKGFILDGGYSEGFGDAMAVLGTRQSCLGRDFFGAGTCLRDATAVILWPPAPAEGVHTIGRRYAGFVWELVQQLRNTYSEDGSFDIANDLVMAAAAANPSSIPDAVHLSFLADDDDGDLSTCSPHFAELAAAADSRNIPRPPDCQRTDCSCSTPGSEGHFAFHPAKKVSANSNILQVTLHLDRPMEVHLTANSSASTNAAPRTFYTGFWNQPSPHAMWTWSYREVTLAGAKQMTNFGSTMALQLPAGDHTFYWKIWITGGEITLSSGVLLVEAFEPAGSGLQMRAAAPEVVRIDERGRVSVVTQSSPPRKAP